MPEQVRCPSCNAALRVPDNLLGKNVRCPKCQTTFLAEIEEPTGIVRESPSPSRSFEMEALEGEEFLEEEVTRPHRRQQRFAEAKALVSGPATALLTVGIIDIVLGVLNLLSSVLGFSLLTMGGVGKKGVDGPEELAVNTVVGIIIGSGTIILGSLITMGALRMKELTSYGLAMTACILALMPCVNCCILGLPFGIWALTVLNKSEVKDAFR